MLKVRRCPHYFTSMINSHVAPQSIHINIVMMHNKDIVARIDRALSSDRMVSHQRSMGYVGNNPSTHGSELSVGHVLTLMSDCVPKEYTKSVDSIIDMGCGGGMMCVTLAMLFRYKKIIGIDSCESRIKHFLELTKEVRVRNVEAINSDWNRVHPDNEV
jgi:Zn-dependent alcohol dehydrogenase